MKNNDSVRLSILHCIQEPRVAHELSWWVMLGLKRGKKEKYWHSCGRLQALPGRTVPRTEFSENEGGLITRPKIAPCHLPDRQIESCSGERAYLELVARDWNAVLLSLSQTFYIARDFLQSI